MEHLKTLWKKHQCWPWKILQIHCKDKWSIVNVLSQAKIHCIEELVTLLATLDRPHYVYIQYSDPQQILNSISVIGRHYLIESICVQRHLEEMQHSPIPQNLWSITTRSSENSDFRVNASEAHFESRGESAPRHKLPTSLQALATPYEEESVVPRGLISHLRRYWTRVETVIFNPKELLKMTWPRDNFHPKYFRGA